MSDNSTQNSNALRDAPINLHPEEFRAAGHYAIDRIADFLASLPDRKLTPNHPVRHVREVLGEGGIPNEGMSAEALMEETADLLFDNSLLNGHPKFLGYITSSPAPIGMLGDLLGAAVNPNVGAWTLAPIATEIETQTVRWLAEMIGYPSECGGILVSGGNMANFVGFLAARHATAKWPIREEGLRTGAGQLRIYVSEKTHTWIEKAADLFGMGTNAIRWIDVDDKERLVVEDLVRKIEKDLAAGDLPFMVVGTAGTVGTGAIDPLNDIADVCERFHLWNHVDGAYGALAAVMPDAPAELGALVRADSVALDPHKWLYSPIEAGCTLVKKANDLRDAFTFHPEYYNFAGENADAKVNLFEYGMQNSRGFRALKVWLSIRQVGRAGFERMIAEDILLAQLLFKCANETPELESVSCNLSITTFRYVPIDLPEMSESNEYVNEVNRRILNRIQAEGEAFVSNAVVKGAYVLRACFVNFRTTEADVIALPKIVIRTGRLVVEEMKKESTARPI